MQNSNDLKIVIDIPYSGLVTADIDVTEHLIRFKLRDSAGRLATESHPLRAADIHVLNEGGLIVLRDQSGNAINLKI